MKLHAISFRPVAQVEFTPDEIQVLLTCSQRHYDAICQQAGRVGGFLFGVSNRASVEQAAHHSLTWRQIDTLAKIVEGARYLHGDEAKLATGLGFWLRTVLLAMNDNTPEDVTLPTGHEPTAPGWWWGRAVVTCANGQPVCNPWAPRRVERADNGKLYVFSRGETTEISGRHGTGGVWWWEWAGQLQPPKT